MKQIIISIFMVLGALFIFLSALGMIKFNEFYSRVHAITKATSFGILLLLISMVLFFGNWIVTLKAIMVIVFIYLTAPLGAHSLGKSYRERTDDGGDE